MQRQFRKRFQDAISIEELRSIARRRLPAFAFEYIDGGAEDEATLRWNRRMFDSIRLVPSTLVNTERRHCRRTIFGVESAAPLIVAPTGLNGMASARGDIALAKAAAAAGIPFTLSSVSNARIADVAQAAGGRLWMQLYVFSERRITLDIIERAKSAGYEALVFTTDANVFGSREWDRRNYRRPGKLRFSRLLDIAAHPRWLMSVPLAQGVPRFVNVADFLPPEARSASAGVTVFPRLLQPNLSWDELKWLRDQWPRKLVLKGVLTVADARRAAELGCDGVVLTNHGGRQLDSCISPMEVLPEIVAAVGDRMTVLIDSGFRRGTDVLKALALGAHAVMIGRAGLYGLASGGEAGARHALSLLIAEIERGLGLLGCRDLGDLGPHLLRKS